MHIKTKTLSAAFLAFAWTSCTDSNRTEFLAAETTSPLSIGRSNASDTQTKNRVAVTTEADLGREYHYYDGDRQRSVWLNKSLLVELIPTDKGKQRLEYFYPRQQGSHVTSRAAGLAHSDPERSPRRRRDERRP